jgi:hypothetical protein
MRQTDQKHKEELQNLGKQLEVSKSYKTVSYPFISVSEQDTSHYMTCTPSFPSTFCRALLVAAVPSWPFLPPSHGLAAGVHFQDLHLKP